MFIKTATLKNYRPFKDEFQLTETHIAVPDNSHPGSGLTVFVGENGVGKSSILDGIALPLIGYKAEAVQLNDFTDIQLPIEVRLNSDSPFTVKKSISGNFSAVGFRFVSKLREQNSSRYMVGTSVSDTYFIPETEGAANANDIRTAVENPFAGPRFNENDYVFIDKNRIKTLESGTYSTTRFDRLLDNLNFLYLKANGNEPLQLHDAIHELVNTEENPISNELLNEAFQYFEEVTGYKVQLNFIDNTLPYKKAFLGFTDLNHAQLPIERIGSGYQMFLALICQHKLSLQSGKKLIMLIDEVELNLHPRLQRSLVDLLLEISKDTQVIITSHSPELLKDLQRDQKYHKTNALVREGELITINPIERFVLPVPTVSETNYVAFGLASIEYFIELYNQFGEMNEQETVAGIDNALGIPNNELIEWEHQSGHTQRLSKYSCIRNKFHHPNNNLNNDKFSYNYEAISEAIEYLREKIAA